MNAWIEMKLFVEQASGVSMDALHVLVGVLLQLLASLLLQRPVSDWRPWLMVLAAALLNEVADLWVEQWPSPAAQYRESVRDVFLTMLLPTVLLLSARYAPGLYRRGR